MLISGRLATGQKNSYMLGVRSSVLRHHFSHILRTCDTISSIIFVLSYAPSQDALTHERNRVRKRVWKLYRLQFKRIWYHSKISLVVVKAVISVWFASLLFYPKSESDKYTPMFAVCIYSTWTWISNQNVSPFPIHTYSKHRCSFQSLYNFGYDKVDILAIRCW